MAWARKRAGQWMACWRLPDGTERSRSGFTRKRDAVAYGTDREQASRAPGWIDPASRTLTVADWAPRWMATKRHLKEYTRHGYQTLVDNRITDRWGDTRLVDITHADVDTWIGQLVDEGLSSDYVRAHRKVLHGMMAVAAAHGLVDTNPVEGVRVPRRKPAQGRWLGADDVERLAAAADRRRPGAGVWVLTTAYGGLRWSESVALRRRHVDLERRRLEVLDDAVEVAGHLTFDDAKTQGPVDLPGFVIERLTDHVAGLGPDELVFTAPRGGPLRYRAFRRDLFDKAVGDCGWSPSRDGGVTPHVLRHSCATILIAEGAHPKMIQTQMRHSSIQVTYDVYGHLFDGAVADVWTRMSDRREGAGEVVDLEARRRASEDSAD